MKIRHGLSALSFMILCAKAMAVPTASVDRTQLTLNDTVTLQIAANDVDGADPNLAPLTQDFNVISTATSAEIQVLNHKTSQHKTWSIVLAPKHDGALTIPSLSLGQDKTAPIAIQVAEAQNTKITPDTTASDASTSATTHDDVAANPQPPIFMQTSVAPKMVYEGQAGLYTVKIFYNTSVREPSLTIPDMGSAKLIHVGQDSNQRTTIAGQNYQVLEQHYAVIAQQDGTLDLKSPTLQGFRLDLTRNDSFNNPWQPFHVSASDLSLQVNNVPGMTKSSWWLPSTKVTLTDSWANNPPQFQNGVPVTRTLTLTAQNVTAEQLPTIAPENSTGFQLYPDKPILNTDSNGFQLQASRVEKIAYLPNATGQFTIPEINIDWWNTDSDSPQKLTIPSYTIQVTSNTNLNVGSNATTTPPLLSLHNIVHSVKEKNNSWYKQPAVILSLLLALAWAITLFLWWRTAKPKSTTKVRGIHQEDVKTMRQLRTELRKACQQSNALDAKLALLSIGKELWPYETVLSVGDLAEKFQQEKTKQLLHELESVLYKEATVWHGADLWLMLDQEFRAQAKQSTDPTDVLPHLYLEEKQ